MAIFIATYFRKRIFEPLYLKFKSLPNFGFGLLWPSEFRRCLGAQLGLGTQPCYEAPASW